MKRVFEALVLTAEMYNQTLSAARIKMMTMDLEDYSEEQILSALTQCRKTCKFFPTIADIIQAIPNGHLSGDEAWSLCPKNEDESCVWTQEIAEAFGAALPLLEKDHIAARKTFLADYEKLIKTALRDKSPIRWSPSLGSNKNGHAAVLEDAVRLGRLPAYQAAAALPMYEKEFFDLDTHGPKQLKETQDE